MRAIDARVNYELGRKKYKRYFEYYPSYTSLCNSFSLLGCPSSLGFKELCNNTSCSTCWEREVKLLYESN